MTSPHDLRNFWRQVFALRGSVTLQVLPRVLTFGAIAAAIWIINELTHEFDFHLAVAPYEVAGAVLGLLLVLRTNAGYDRWWEARKLWGGIVNQSRNLAISGLSYGPNDPVWQAKFVRWIAAFPNVARCSLRGERDLPAVVALLGKEETSRIAAGGHMPTVVVLTLAQMLRQAMDDGSLDRMAFMQIDKERAALIDHIGGCERILKSPLPRVYAITIRRFIFLFLAALPFALLDKVGLVCGLSDPGTGPDGGRTATALCNQQTGPPPARRDLADNREEPQRPVATRAGNHRRCLEGKLCIVGRVCAVFGTQRQRDLRNHRAIRRLHAPCFLESLRFNCWLDERTKDRSECRYQVAWRHHHQAEHRVEQRGRDAVGDLGCLDRDRGGRDDLERRDQPLYSPEQSEQ
jgi:putative membrane protein